MKACALILASVIVLDLFVDNYKPDNNVLCIDTTTDTRVSCFYTTE